jgi:uncharacterized protein YkwD
MVGIISRGAGAALLLAISAFVVLAASPEVKSAVAAPCAHSGDTHAQASIGQLRDATVCLINRRRAQRDKRRLDQSARLGDAAERHTRVMLRTDCLDHRCPGEPSLGQRIRKTGYLNGADRWRFAESTGCKGTPRRMVEAWMDVRFHRRNLLDAAYRDLGAGLRERSPDVGGCKGNPDLTTFTVVVAFRRG